MISKVLSAFDAYTEDIENLEEGKILIFVSYGFVTININTLVVEDIIINYGLKIGNINIFNLKKYFITFK